MTDPDIHDEAHTYAALDIEAFRGFVGIAASIDDECRIVCDGKGLHISLVDPANVTMVEVSLYGDALPNYTFRAEEPVEIGVPIERLESSLTHLADQRIGVEPCSVFVREGAIETHAGGATLNAKTQTIHSIGTLDPSKLRNKPDTDFEVQTEWKGDVTPEAFADAVDGAGWVSNHIQIRENAGFIELEAQGDTEEATARMKCDYDPVDGGGAEGAQSLFTHEFLEWAAHAIHTARATNVTLEWGQTVPMRIGFGRVEDGETVFDGAYYIAPRLES